MNLLFFSALTMFINCGSVKWATRIQDTFTFGKLIALVILIVIGLIEVGSGKQKQVQLWHLNNNNNNNNNIIIIIIIIIIFTQTLNTWNILGMFYEISRAKKVLWCCTSPASAGFGLSKHVIRDTPPRMVFVSVRFLLRSIHVFSSQRSFVVSTWSF